MNRLNKIGIIAACVAGLAAAGCMDPKRNLVPVPVPDAKTFEPAVRTALDKARAEFDRVAAENPPREKLADAYGELAMMYHVHALAAPAEAAYNDARMLAPKDKRWPYLEGHLFNDTSRQAAAIQAFEAARAIEPNNTPILFSLGEVYLQHGDFDQAHAVFNQLQRDGQARAAALMGMGKAALAKRQYKEAAEDLEGALQLWPGATRLRQPLAMAYRGLGDNARADENMKLYSAKGIEPDVLDPMVEPMGAKIASAHGLAKRGQRFADAGRFDLAEPLFRASVAASRDEPDAMANLGISLANLGRAEEAKRWLSEALAKDGNNAVAHMSLGVVLDRLGENADAAKEYQLALEQDPANLSARIYFADLLLRSGAFDKAAAQYQKALEIAPESSRVCVSLAMTKVRQGRYAEAEKILEKNMVYGRGKTEVGNALARLLATAPDAHIRDGKRALELSEGMFNSTGVPEFGETYAMALAETGRFEQAVTVQKGVLTIFEGDGAVQRLPTLKRNLEKYEHHQPVREGWAPDDPWLQPRSPAVQPVKAKQTS